jgi:hypothetical protein
VLEAELRRSDLELALVRVLEELRRPEDRVDDRPDVGEERGAGGACHQYRVPDPAPGVKVRPGDQGDPHHHEEENQEVHEEVESVVGDAEQG